MIWLQVITIFFAVALAWLNKWPVIVFRAQVQQGHKSEKEFHAANAVVKMMWAAAIVAPSVSVHFFLCVLVLLLWLWLVFDIALNIFTGKPAFYLGKTAWLDKLVKNGKVKAIVVFILIIILNYLIL